ncbi:hypothetical protein EJ02DRAFT_446143 [Clathrospora elynae]|uniref:Uncharacterized protein n=1 Tax=Clathrospora elynae TaxID=706981 RepID=A0A6A5SIM9_9PLEO|nr:hypothetical protein EJ02DRAFT_446143 [Clathrospora elynae]
MRNPNSCRLILLLTPPLLLLLPVAFLTTILERISKNLFYSQIDRNFRTGAFEIILHGPNSTGSSNLTNIEVTLNSNQAYAVSALGAFEMWELRRVEGTGGHDRMWSCIVFFSNIIMIGASLGTFGYTSSVQGSDKSRQSYEDVGNFDQEHTRETWACQIDKFHPDQDWAGQACGTAKATRFLLIPMAVAALMFFVSLWFVVCARGGLKWDVYEMQPPGPPSPYPVQQWGPQHFQQWGPQPVQQRMLQPIPQLQKAELSFRDPCPPAVI